MVSYNNDEFMILGGYGNSGYLCDVTINDTSNEYPNGMLEHRTIVQNNTDGHAVFETSGN